MPECECGCEEHCVKAKFRPGHDQRLRIALERRVGGILLMRDLVDATDAYTAGTSTADQLIKTVQQIYTTKPH